MEKVEKSLKFVDGRYQVPIPWEKKLPRVARQIRNGVQTTSMSEKRLLKKKDIAKAYSDCIEQYTSKGCIRKVPSSQDRPLARCPYIVKPDRATTKTRIVFDASVRYQGVSLNDVICQGSKLQHHLFHVLLRSRKNPFTLVCGIAEMYLRIEIAPVDRSFHSFLWRGLDRKHQKSTNSVESYLV